MTYVALLPFPLPFPLPSAPLKCCQLVSIVNWPPAHLACLHVQIESYVAELPLPEPLPEPSAEGLPAEFPLPAIGLPLPSALGLPFPSAEGLPLPLPLPIAISLVKSSG